MHWQFGEIEFGEMKRNTSNWSNFGMLLRRAGLRASAGLSCRISDRPPSWISDDVIILVPGTDLHGFRAVKPL